ncbi:dipeptide epimerase [Luteimonas sp. 3794]|uniref:dipeptide epimerase n=1 Tax=Luteimonas sp. 3794 TaxID=2817730 RepID=UPI00285F8887|nr:dipeptide epimerase [Luteimonas sp. 3794]MDR6989998.1 L-alanine-DL-glutamate epimerase-like enolase superfamily enzyme [Luteimonas sp. 3794]
MTAQPVELELHNEPLPLSAPFRIAGHVFSAMPATVVTLRAGAHVGRGEAAGVYYTHDHPETMLATLEAMRPRIEAGLDRETLRTLLPAGGARNALDAALWELESQQAGVPVWRLAGLDGVRTLLTTFTVGADDPAVMADHAAAYTQARALKLKLTGDADLDAARVRAVRARCPAAWIAVDANQGYDGASLPALMPALLEAGVALLEQPCVRGREHELDGITRALPFAADESILDLAELEARHHHFDVINIKLDKCGGLTEGLLMARRARELGKQVMVGNMCGTSLAAAPAFVLGQFCDVVDLDGPIFLKQDRSPSVRYTDGHIWCGDEVWGPSAA